MPLGWTVDWKRVLWDRLSNNDIRRLLCSLPEEDQQRLRRSISDAVMSRIGWCLVCRKCKRPYTEQDCGCAAGCMWVSPILSSEGTIKSVTDPALYRYQQFRDAGGSHQMFIAIYRLSIAEARALKRAYESGADSRA